MRAQNIQEAGGGMGYGACRAERQRGCKQPGNLDIGRIIIPPDHGQRVGAEPDRVVIAIIELVKLDAERQRALRRQDGQVQGMATPSWVRTLRRSTISGLSGAIDMACLR